MSKINWQVRINNPIWWMQVIASIVMPMIVGVGMQWADMTTWQTLGGALLLAVQNPVVVVAMFTSLWATITDPTTKGFGDTSQTMTYTTPKEG